MKTERELFLRYWTDNNLPYDGDDDDMKVAWTAWQASIQREGYRIVPVEPSEDMIMAGCMEHGGYDVIDSKSIYKAMIEAVEK